MHPPIAFNNLYWVIPVPQGALSVSPDGRQATLTMQDVSVVDQPKWPAHDTPTYPARISFRIEWAATSTPVTHVDPAKLFRFSGWQASARLEAQVEVPALSFSWRSDPLSTSSASFGIIGQEQNGRYFEG